MSLLKVEKLRVSFAGPTGPLTVVRGIDLSLAVGETLAIVGESGSGKSVTSLALMGLLDKKAQIEGQFFWKDESFDPRRGRHRGHGFSMIFQNPMSSLNPVMKVGTQVIEPLLYHRSLKKSQAKVEALKLFDEVGLPSEESFYHSYPHQLSGGMRQRVMIAMALACQPEILIADEPTTALDVTIQAQILDLLKDLQQRRQMALIMVTHDMSVVKSVADQVAVMYAGLLVEKGSRDEVLNSPRHPYTKALLASIPRLDQKSAGPLPTIGGRPPSPLEIGPGCPFAPRCAQREPRCLEEAPHLRSLSGGRSVRCLLEEAEA